MKKKICLKQKYWGYCFKCNQENKLQKLMLKSYSISFEDMTDEHWALGKKNRINNYGKRYLLVAKKSFGINTTYFCTIKEAKAYSKNLKYSKTTIIDLKNENIKWQGCE